MDIKLNIYREIDLSRLSLIKLGLKQIHLWIINWRKVKELLDEENKSISYEEKAKIDKYFNYNDKMRSLTGIVLTKILGSYYLNIDKSKLKIERNYYNKPDIKGISYNISHSGDYVVLSFTFLKAIGVDIERIRNIPEYKEISTYFCDSERKIIEEAKNIRKFFYIWTAKEAYVKALGKGLSIELKSFEIKRKRIYEKEKEVKKWRLFSIELEESYYIAVVVNEN